MSGVDVVTSVDIRRPVRDVAAFAADPANAPRWYRRIESVDWVTEPPVAVGSRLAFRARFMGREMRYVYEVTHLRPGERMVMRTAEGPFPMETTYAWEATPEGATRMVLRNRGRPAGAMRLAGPLVAAMVRRANREDLARLKALLESG